MSVGTAFWVVLILSVVFGCFGYFGPEVYHTWAWGGFSLVELVLFCLVGYQIFGGPIQKNPPKA